PVVTLDRDAITKLGQRAAIDAFGAALDEGARAEVAHELAGEAAGAGDEPRLGGDRSAQALCGGRALLAHVAAGREAREGEREGIERHRPGRHRAAVDRTILVRDFGAG